MNISRQHARIVYNFDHSKAYSAGVSASNGDLSAMDRLAAELAGKPLHFTGVESHRENKRCTAGYWELEVMGKNGVTVNGTLHTPSAAAVRLRSRDLITMGDSSFHFLLPCKVTRYDSAAVHHNTLYLKACLTWTMCVISEQGYE